MEMKLYLCSVIAVMGADLALALRVRDMEAADGVPEEKREPLLPGLVDVIIYLIPVVSFLVFLYYTYLNFFVSDEEIKRMLEESNG